MKSVQEKLKEINNWHRANGLDPVPEYVQFDSSLAYLGEDHWYKVNGLEWFFYSEYGVKDYFKHQAACIDVI